MVSCYDYESFMYKQTSPGKCETIEDFITFILFLQLYTSYRTYSSTKMFTSSIYIYFLVIVYANIGSTVILKSSKTADSINQLVGFMEGGSVISNKSQNTNQSTLVKTHSINSTEKSNYKVKESLLNDYISNLTDSIPILNHSNSSSSIKPRKGALYSEPEINHSENTQENCTLHFSTDCKGHNSADLVNSTNLNFTQNSSRSDTSFSVPLSVPKKTRHKPEITQVPEKLKITPISTASNAKDYLVPLVSLLIVIPIVFLMVMFLYKKLNEYWETRNYKRVDFLIDGIYNN